MGETRLLASDADLLRCRFAISPLWETVNAARAFVDAARAADKRLVVYEGFRHEIFNEVERERPIAEAATWMSARLG